MIMECLENIGGSKLFDQAMVAWTEMAKLFPSMHKPLESESGFFILDDNGDVISFALFFESEESELVISLAWTHPDHRQKGMYRSLFTVIKSLAQRKGISTVVAGVHMENLKSMKVHERLGMKPQAIWYQMKVDAQ